MEISYSNDEILINDRSIDVALSDRLAKDAESLMNSTYWVDALKNRKAVGIGNQLYCRTTLQYAFHHTT